MKPSQTDKCMDEAASTGTHQQPSLSTQRFTRQYSRGHGHVHPLLVCFYSLCQHRNTCKTHLLSLKAKHQTSLRVKEWVKLFDKWEWSNNEKELCRGFWCLVGLFGFGVPPKAEVVPQALQLSNLRTTSHESELSDTGRSRFTAVKAPDFQTGYSGFVCIEVFNLKLTGYELFFTPLNPYQI